MCHITFINRIDNNIIKEFNRVMRISAESNDDGFGCFSNKTKYKNSKQFKKRHYNSIKSKFINDKFLIGHTRTATSGKVCNVNTHPFETENITYVHNGIITNYKNLNKKLKVDSKVIGYLLEKELKDKKTIEKAIENSVKKLVGSFSIFIYYKPKKRLFYIRHNAWFEFMYMRFKNKNYLVGATDIENLYKMFSKTYKDMVVFKGRIIAQANIFDDTIYEIKNHKIKEIKEIEILDEDDVFICKDNDYMDSDLLGECIAENEMMLSELTDEMVEISASNYDRFMLFNGKKAQEKLYDMGFDKELSKHDLFDINEELHRKVNNVDVSADYMRRFKNLPFA